MMGIISCKETTRLVSQGLDRELAFGERVALRVHLVICLGCRRAGRQMEFLRKAVRELAEIDLRTGF
ncbi:MAG: zf-HC2 domain-containing protein [Betaproteobacteria bacterium]|nr:zf-HC2 domain-containing protein [Betaproteobacteria bacterium]